MGHPKDVAVNPNTHVVYVTSRDNNRVYALNGLTLQVMGSAAVGSQPWGIAVNPGTNKVYVGNFASGNVYVLNASTLAVLKTISVGPEVTFVRINLVTNRVFVVTHGNNSVVVINGSTDTVEATVNSGGAGAWGLAVNPNLNRVYVSNRDTSNIATLDGNNSWAALSSQSVRPCEGTLPAPYSLEFNPVNNKLYNVCAPSGSVNLAIVYQASAGGLSRLSSWSIPNGGGDAGGGIAVDTATGNALITNSASNNVSVIGGSSNNVVGTMAVGSDPFGIAVDTGTRWVFTANRSSNNLTVFADTYSPMSARR